MSKSIPTVAATGPIPDATPKTSKYPACPSCGRKVKSATWYDAKLGEFVQACAFCGHQPEAK